MAWKAYLPEVAVTGLYWPGSKRPDSALHQGQVDRCFDLLEVSCIMFQKEFSTSLCSSPCQLVGRQNVGLRRQKVAKMEM